MPKSLRPICLAIVIAASPAASAADPEPRYCEIALDFSLDGLRIAAPTVLAEFGKDAEVTLRDANGKHAWRFRIAAERPVAVRGRTAIPIGIGVFEMQGDEAVLRAEPHVGVEPGQHAELGFDLEGPKQRVARLDVTASLSAAR